MNLAPNPAAVHAVDDNQLEIQNLEELDEFDYDPDFFNGIFPKQDNPALHVHRPQDYPTSPSLAGYTSEESDYSTTTTSDAGRWSPSSTTSSTTSSLNTKRGHPTMNDGTMTNGKTSLYRGVTRTSKTAWGAKYSSKRIINTCRTQEEAARAYDAYLKENVPDKYVKYANFCPTCDQYTNSLGLAWAKKVCTCHDASSTASPTRSPFHDVKDETDHEDASNQAMEDFMTDNETFQFTSPEKPRVAPTPYLSMSSFEVAAKTDTIFIKDEPAPMYAHLPSTSSSLPDDDVLATLLSATANAAAKTLSPLALDITPEMFDNLSAPHSLDNNARDSLSRLLHASSSFDFMDDFQNAGGVVSEFDPQVHVAIDTVFLRKYFRNDRKNLQCFPYCREHGNYYEAKMQGLEHAGKGVCRAPVKVVVSHPAPPTHMVVLARCQTIARADEAPLSLSFAGLHALQQSWTSGTTSDASTHATNVYFLPEVWKFDAELPKKRRVDDNDRDDLNYFVQVVVYVSKDGEHFERTAAASSNGFDIQSTRTLLRQKQKKDDEDVLFMLGVPEKKKLRTDAFKDARRDSSIALTADHVDLTHVDWAPMGKPDDALFDDEDEAAMAHVPEPKQDKVTIVVEPAPVSTTTAASSVGSVSPQARAKTTYTQLNSPKTKPTTVAAAAPLAVQPTPPPAPAAPAAPWQTQFCPSLVVYGLVNLPLGLVFALVHLLLLPLSLAAPRAAVVVQMADGLADMDLYFANSLSPRASGHALLDRVDSRAGMARRHAYFVLLKTPLTLVGLAACLVLNVLAVVTLVVPPASKGFRAGANASGMLAVNASKTYCGKPSSSTNLRQPDHVV